MRGRRQWGSAALLAALAVVDALLIGRALHTPTPPADAQLRAGSFPPVTPSPAPTLSPTSAATPSAAPTAPATPTSLLLAASGSTAWRARPGCATDPAFATSAD